MRRLLAALGAGLFAALSVGSPAAADPAGPTDYFSEIRSVEPATPSIELAVLGGDSFVQLIASPGTEVMVLGYQGEDYLWFQPDGTVVENQNAPSTYTNDDRYGGGDIPATASADAEPDWEEVASSGQYSWHDHRAHWMQTIRPVGAQVGDQIVEGIIPLVVDDVDVDVTVISTWKAEPSNVPALAGVLLGLAAAAGGVALWRSRQQWQLAAIPLAVLALAVGAIQFTSLPSETGPRLVWWLFPAIATVSVAVAAVAGRFRSEFVAGGAALVAGVQLVMWGLIKRDGLTAALIPTDAPGWLDRLATTAALTGGVGVAALALWVLFRPHPAN